MGQVLRTLVDYHLYQQDKHIDTAVDPGRELGEFELVVH